MLTQIPPSSATNACTPQSSQPNTLHSTTIPAMQQPTTNAIKSNLNPHLEDTSHQTHWESPRTARWSYTQPQSQRCSNQRPMQSNPTSTHIWKTPHIKPIGNHPERPHGPHRRAPQLLMDPPWLHMEPLLNGN